MDASDTPSAHACTTITFEISLDKLAGYNDEYLAQLWHISQANPAPYGDRAACEFAEHVARECVRRFVSGVPTALWTHQGRHAEKARQLDDKATVDLDDLLSHSLPIAPGEVLSTEALLEKLGLPAYFDRGRLRTSLLRHGFTWTRIREAEHVQRAWKAPTA